MTHKLELKHIAPYLPYGLTSKTGFETPQIITGICSYENRVYFGEFGSYWTESIKPILRPLSDLTNEIEYYEENFPTLDLHKQCSQIIEDDRWVNHCDYLLIQDLFEKHFDVFGLIEKGLAIDINTI